MKPKAPAPKKVMPKAAKSEGGTNKERAEAYVNEARTSPRFRGKVQVKMACDYTTPYHTRRPTGIMGLDLALGGGFHAGGVGQIYGANSAGKTHLAFRTAGQVQRNYGEDAVIVVASSEIRLDKGFARRSGLCVAYGEDEIDFFDSIRATKQLPPFTEEEKDDLRKQIGTIIVSVGVTGDQLLNSTIDTLSKLRNVCQLIIIESLGALITPDQDEKDVGDRVFGGSALMLTTWMNKVYPQYMMDGEDGSVLETTILAINQVRAVLDGGPHGPKTRPAAGSKSIEHAQLSNIELRTGETLYADASRTVKCGHTIKWEIKKGKAGTHDGLRGEYNWYHMPAYEPVFWSEVELQGSQYGIDTITDLCDTARIMDVVRAAGAYITFEDPVGPTVKVQGTRDNPAKDQFAQLVVNDPELERRVRQACLAKANLSVKFR